MESSQYLDFTKLFKWLVDYFGYYDVLELNLGSITNVYMAKWTR